MGAGLALECKLRYPEMYSQYVKLCNNGAIDIGKLWLYKSPARWVLNFPTKRHWKHPSKESYLRLGLDKFLNTYASRGITSAAFPLLGAQHGGLDQDQSLDLMQHYLQNCSIPIDIYKYDPKAPDDLYEVFKSKIMGEPIDALMRATGLRSNSIQLLKEAVASPQIYQLNQLAGIKGIGDKTLEAAFALMRNRDDSAEQGSLF
jgi:hypothetical protein